VLYGSDASFGGGGYAAKRFIRDFHALGTYAPTPLELTLGIVTRCPMKPTTREIIEIICFYQVRILIRYGYKKRS
jgi:hypothetical protein